MSDATTIVTVVAAVAAALVGGIFFAFSSFVMRALDALGPAEATRAMQSINRTVLHPSFLGVFLGAAVGAVVVVVVHWGGPRSVPALAGAVAYVVGTFGVTGVFNVPRNDALGEVQADSDEVDEAWTRYRREWTRWNHLRTAMAVVAAVLWIAAVVAG